MPLFHAVVWLDHQSAQVLQFDAAHVQSQKIKTHTHHTRQHGSLVRTEHEFFGDCSCHRRCTARQNLGIIHHPDSQCFSEN